MGIAATDSELNALLSLLDDSDPTITTAVQKRLLSYGGHVVPFLRQLIARAPSESPLAMNAQACIRALQTEALASIIEMVINARAKSKDIELELALLQLSQFAYPETDILRYQRYLDDLAIEVRKYERSLPVRSDAAGLMALNIVLFERERFRGAIKGYYSPSHTYLTTVLESREGIPIALSCIYSLVGQRLGMELWGIGMPLHFVVYHPYLDVFIDPFNAGAFISRDECRRFIQHAGFTFNASMLERRSNIEILVRTLRNLIYAHTRAGQQWEADTLREALDTILRLLS